MVLTSAGSLLIVPPTLGQAAGPRTPGRRRQPGYEPRDRGRERGSYSLFAGKGTKLWAGSPWWGWSASAWPAWHWRDAIILRNGPETVQQKLRRQVAAVVAATRRVGKLRRNKRPAAPVRAQAFLQVPAATPVGRGAVPAVAPQAVDCRAIPVGHGVAQVPVPPGAARPTAIRYSRILLERAASDPRARAVWMGPVG